MKIIPLKNFAREMDLTTEQVKIGVKNGKYKAKKINGQWYIVGIVTKNKSEDFQKTTSKHIEKSFAEHQEIPRPTNNKKVLISIVAAVMLIGAFVTWFVTGPARVFDQYYACNADWISFHTKEDQEYFKKIRMQDPDFLSDDIFIHACVEKYEANDVSIEGLTSTISYTATYPDFESSSDYEFPVTMLYDQKIALLKERAAKAKKATMDGTTNLIFDFTGWKVFENFKLQYEIIETKTISEASIAEGNYKHAIKVFEDFIASRKLDIKTEKELLELRLEQINTIICREITNNILKFPDSAEYEFNSYLSSSITVKNDGKDEVSTFGKVKAANSLGVKSSTIISCRTSIFPDKAEMETEYKYLGGGDSTIIKDVKTTYSDGNVSISR